MYDRDLKALKRPEGFSLIQTATHVRLIQILAICVLCENKTGMPGLSKYY
jgi:hypothetical protein